MGLNIRNVFKAKEDPDFRETILDKRVADSKGKIILNATDYTQNSKQLVIIESIIDQMVDAFKVIEPEPQVTGQLLKSRKDNLFYFLTVGGKRGQFQVKIPVRVITNLPVFTFSDKARFAVHYKNNITKSVKLTGAV